MMKHTYEQSEEDVLGALDGKVDWTTVPGAQKAQAEHMHLHDPVCFAIGMGPLQQKLSQNRDIIMTIELYASHLLMHQADPALHTLAQCTRPAQSWAHA